VLILRRRKTTTTTEKKNPAVILVKQAFVLVVPQREAECVFGADHVSPYFVVFAILMTMTTLSSFR
jgi:hypothetical protein